MEEDKLKIAKNEMHGWVRMVEKCACVRWDVIQGNKVILTDENTNHLAIPEELLEKYNCQHFQVVDTQDGLLLNASLKKNRCA